MRATVITDASHCHQTNAAGWAAWIRVDGVDGPIKRYGELRVRPKNSTEAEMYAALNGLHVAKAHGATVVLLQSDNQSVVAMASDSTYRGAHSGVWRKELRALGLDTLTLSARHVKGHTSGKDARHWVNNWCDVWARKSMKEARKRGL